MDISLQHKEARLGRWRRQQKQRRKRNQLDRLNLRRVVRRRAKVELMKLATTLSQPGENDSLIASKLAAKVAHPVSGRLVKPRCLQQLIKKLVEATSREVEHVFVLLVFIGIGEEKRLESNDLFFRDLKECVWYAQTLHKQGNLVTAYCLPRYVNPGNVRIY